MGWNSWNYFGKEAIDEKLIRETIDAMVSSGLKTAGYEYVVVDGGWRDTLLGIKHTTGYGIGLYLVAEVLRFHQTKIELDSAPGKGSTFYFLLPLDEETAWTAR